MYIVKTFSVVYSRISSSPPISSIFGPLGLNLKSLIKDMKNLAKDYNDGEKIYFTVKIKMTDKTYTIFLRSRPLIKKIFKDNNFQKGTSDNKTVLNISREYIINLAKTVPTKLPLEKRIIQIIGVCKSAGISVTEK